VLSLLKLVVEFSNLDGALEMNHLPRPLAACFSC
jgi:hypothetical protein